MNIRYLKTLAFFFMLLTAIPLLTTLLLQVHQHQIQRQMKEKLEQHCLLTVIVEKKSVHWIKPGKEILLGGRMFDIKTVKTDHNNYIFTGLYDDDETMLVEKMKDNRNHNNNSGARLLIQLIQVLQTPCENNSLLQAAHSEITAVAYREWKESPLSQYKRISTPPPRLYS